MSRIHAGAVPRHQMTGSRDFEAKTRRQLLSGRWMRLHAFAIGAITLAGCWLVSWSMLKLGVDDLVMRSVAALTLTYFFYLALLWAWSQWLLSRSDGLDEANTADLAWDVTDVGVEAGWPMAGRVMSGLGELAAGAGEAAFVAVPVAAVVGVFLLATSALGIAVFGIFGVDVLLGVAIEVAFASAGAAFAFRAERSGWLGFAVRKTVGPMALVTFCGLGAGLMVKHFVPEAKTFGQAAKTLATRWSEEK